jgi:hypothetical protein
MEAKSNFCSLSYQLHLADLGKLGFKRRRASVIGALNEGKVKAPRVIEGYCNSEIFEAYVQKAKYRPV